MKKRKAVSLPNKKIVFEYTLTTLFVCMCWQIFYKYCNSYSAGSSHFYHMYFDWELAIPLVPSMILVYFSSLLFYIIPAFTVFNRDQLVTYFFSMLGALFVSCIVFYNFPSHLGFTRVVPDSAFGFMFAWLHKADLPHNLFPSLHVMSSYMSAFVILKNSESKRVKSFVALWFISICISVVLVHQHHLFDIFMAIILSNIMTKILYSIEISQATKALNTTLEMLYKSPLAMVRLTKKSKKQDRRNN